MIARQIRTFGVIDMKKNDEKRKIEIKIRVNAQEYEEIKKKNVEHKLLNGYVISR